VFFRAFLVFLQMRSSVLFCFSKNSKQQVLNVPLMTAAVNVTSTLVLKGSGILHAGSRNGFITGADLMHQIMNNK
jgi:hypothetical protein